MISCLAFIFAAYTMVLNGKPGRTGLLWNGRLCFSLKCP
jgi:hypothetical protein